MKYGVREVVDIVFKAKADMKLGNMSFKKGQPVIVFDSAKTSSLEGDSTEVFAQGGKGNPKRVSWSGEKSLTFTFEDALITPISAAILMGANIATKSTFKQHVYGEVVCSTTDTLDCSGLVADANFTKAGATAATKFTGTVWATKLDDDGSLGTAIEVTEPGSNVNALTVTGAVEGSRYLVDGYVDVTSGTSISIEPNKFSDYFYVEGNTFWRRESDGVDAPAQITLPKAKVQSKFTLSMNNSGDPSTFTFTMNAMPDYVNGSTKKTLCQIDVLD